MSKISDAQIKLAEASDGDECPLCHAGTVEIVGGVFCTQEVRCRGECGAVSVKRDALYDFDIAFQSALGGYGADRRRAERRKAYRTGVDRRKS